MFRDKRRISLLRPRASDAPDESKDSMLAVEFAHLSDVGRVREHNEDYVGHAGPANPEQVRSHGWLFALADGVGGQDRGEVASRTAVEAIVAGFQKAAAGTPPVSLLQRIVQQANTSVYETALATGPGGSNMATTVVACLLRYDRAIVAHVGDSRCYLIRRGRASQLTRDHTFASDQARLGLISSEDVAESDSRHVLSRSLGANLVVNVDIDEHQVLAGDVLLMCCDGMHGAVTPQEMATAVNQERDLKVAAEKLVALANDKDGSDNISVQLIRVLDVERIGMYRGRPYKLR
jgi:PPM family protein phosphatase